jgi:hypothetical protein
MPRAVTGFLVALSLFAVASPASAAAVDIRVSLVPGTTDWTLSVRTEPGVEFGRLELAVAPFDSLHLNPLPGPPVICAYYLGGCPGEFLPLPNGLSSFYVVGGFVTQDTTALLVPSGGEASLGTFRSQVTAAALVTVVAPQFSESAAFDVRGAPITSYSITVTPEPTALIWLALGAGILLRLTRP